MSKHAPAPIDSMPSGARVAVAAARFNRHIVERLLDGCDARLAELKTHAVDHFYVPGAYELPLAAKWLVESKRYDAVICLGAVVRGDTPHFEFVAGECARGLREVSTSTGIPVIFGVLTTDTEQQAFDRAGGAHSHVGRQSADAAAEMIALRNEIRKIKPQMNTDERGLD